MNAFKNSKQRTEIPTIDDVYHLVNAHPNLENTRADIIFKNILKIDTASKSKSQFWKYITATIVVIMMVFGYFLNKHLCFAATEAAAILTPNNFQIGLDKTSLALRNTFDIPLPKKIENLLTFIIKTPNLFMRMT